MARKKNPENETEEQAYQRKVLETIANASGRSEKTSWNRKMDNMVNLISRLRPIEEQIIDLNAQKTPILDEISQLRAVMVAECVHPFEQLVYKDDHAECKFCGARLGLPSID